MARIENKICPITNCGKAFRSKAKACSNRCGVLFAHWGAAGKRPEPIEKTCPICDKKHTGTGKTCSANCGGKLIALNRGQKIQELVTFICVECKKPFTKKKRNTKSNHTYEFCSRKCSSIVKSRNGAGLATNEKRYEYWLKKHGKEIADQKLQKMYDRRSASGKKGIGRECPQERRDRIAESVRNCGFVHPWTDKTLEEIFGEEKAKQMADDQSNRLLEGFKSGRIVPVPVRRQLTSYGFYVRSKNEIKFIKRLEKLGLVYNVDWFYERKEDRIPYLHPDGKEHVYYPDFNVLGEIIEIKDGAEEELNDPIVKAKEQAALKIFENNYSIVVKRKIKKWLPKFLFETVQSA